MAWSLLAGLKPSDMDVVPLHLRVEMTWGLLAGLKPSKMLPVFGRLRSRNGVGPACRIETLQLVGLSVCPAESKWLRALAFTRKALTAYEE